VPPLEDLDHHDPALLWEFRRYDGAGDLVVADVPEPVDVQWVDRTKFLRGPDGQQVQIDATVAVTRDVSAGPVPLNSLMFRGELSDYTAGVEVTVMQVVSRAEARDLKGRAVRREYGLAFYRGKLPTTTGP
jgi:hypothetical protein